jgi:transcriptional regulator with XRE-family HTH domain
MKIIPQELRGRVATRIRGVMGPYVKGNRKHFSEAAADLGVTYNAVWFWYNGWTLPRIDNLINFADYYDISLDYLLGRTTVRELQTHLKIVKRKVA